MSFTVDPLRRFEIRKGGSGEVAQLTCARVAGAVGTDRLLVAAVTGKRIRVMGVRVYSASTTVSVCLFHSGTGTGTLLCTLVAPSNALAQGHADLPVIDSGYFETSTGEGLYVDVTTTDAVFNVFYITYTP